MTKKRWAYIGGLTLAVVWSSFVLPPVIHTLRGLCPVGPSGIKEANAVPPFARKYGITCQTCHTAFPALNDYGREFKKNGYVREREAESGAAVENSDMLIPKQFPWGGIVKSRPLDKSKHEKGKVRALHALELFIADGSVAKNFSYFGKIEMEDDSKIEGEDSTGGEIEGETGFTPKLAHLRLGYHHNRYLNAIAAYDVFLNAVDPYQTISVGGTHLTAHGSDALGLIAGHHGGEQTVAIRGEARAEGIVGLNYAFGATGGAAHGAFSPEGGGPINYHFRLAADTYRGFMLGAYAKLGEDGWDAARNPEHQTRAFAVDALVEAFDVSVRGALIATRRRTNDGGALRNENGGYLEAFYTFKKDDRPLITPLLRYDVKSRVNGNKTQHMVAHASFYPRQNVRTFVEYWKELKDDTGGGAATVANDLDNRLFFQVEVGF